MNEYKTQLLHVRRGLMWMIAGYVWFMVTFVGGMTLMEAIIADVPYHLRCPYYRYESTVAITSKLVFVGMQLVAAWYCWQCPKEVIRWGKTWIFTSAAFYGVFLLAVLSMTFLDTELGRQYFQGNMFALGTITRRTAVWCFGISAWFWLYFLLKLARGIRSSAGTLAGRGAIFLFTVAGFCTMFFFEIMIPFHEYFLNAYPARIVMYTAWFSGFAFMGLYACLLPWLWWRIGRL